MPLAMKKFLIIIIPIILTSLFSGCIFEDFLGGTTFNLVGYEICDDDGFPSLSINFSCSNTAKVKILGTDNKIIDSDLFFKGRHNTILSLGEYKQTISPMSYKIKAYDKDNSEIYSNSVYLTGSNIEILSCLQNWWNKDTSFSRNFLFELGIYVYNKGDVPVYPYDVQIDVNNEATIGLALPIAIMPKKADYVNSLIYLNSTFSDSLFDLNIRDIDGDIIANQSVTVNTNNKVQTKEFSWNYYGPHKVELPKPGFLYDYQSKLERINNDDYSLYVFDPYDDEYIDIILEKIMFGFTGTKVQKINYIASFVQTIEYKSDSDDNSSYEYPRFPVETLFDGRGDCEDKAILTASLLYSLGYDIALLRLPNHMAVGVRLSEEDIPNYEYYIEDYYFLETTTKGKTCGFIPLEYREYNDSATIYPITNRPLLIHSWKEGTITIYTNTEIGDFVNVKAIIENLGIISARNVLVEGAFITANGFKANYENIVISDLDPGIKKKVTLSIDIPKSLTTYFKTRVYLNSEIVDEKESVSSFP